MTSQTATSRSATATGSRRGTGWTSRRRSARDDAIGMQYLIPGWRFDNERPSMVR
ncbi:hypothetical protein [Miniimonas arenae]|uniref:hypothetical protein n=1 Tax=Miniimonas arenae TaxID=676201 RepID=UPI0028A9813E|nr:hypothetical protein [Miniimonas arenae]